MQAEREALDARLEEHTAERAYLRLQAIHADRQAASLREAIAGSPDQLVAARAALLVATGTPDAAQTQARIEELQTKVATWRQQFDEVEAILAADTERLRSLEELGAALENQRATAQKRLGEELAEVYAREIAEAKARRETATREAQDAADTERALWRRMQGELETWPELLAAQLRRSKHLAHEPNATPLQRVAAAALAYFQALNREAKESPIVIGFDGTNVADVLEIDAREVQLLIQRPHGPRWLPDEKLNTLQSWAEGEVRADSRPLRAG